MVEYVINVDYSKNGANIVKIIELNYDILLLVRNAEIKLRQSIEKHHMGNKWQKIFILNIGLILKNLNTKEKKIKNGE
jgi:hypothetical protein